MKKRHIHNTLGSAVRPVEASGRSGSLEIKSAIAIGRFWTLVALIFIATIASSWAQSVTMRSQPLRFTLPKGVASSNFVTLTIPVSGLVNPGVDTINLAVTGVPGSGTANAWLNTNGLKSNLTYTATLILTNDATIVAGDYDMAVVATGAASYRLPVPVQVAYVWSGSDYTNSVSTNWAATGNWLGGALPGSTDPVVFKDISSTTNITTNIVVASDVTVASIRFSPETAARRFNTMEILNGVKLSVTGAGLSFSMHRDSMTTSAAMDAKISGGGTLEVVNPSAQIGLLVNQQQNTTLDMRDLNNFVADISRIGLGNFRIWPNVYTNGYIGEGGTAAQNMPFREVPLVWLAKTNVIKCSWVDPNNYNDTGIRDYAIEVGNDTATGTTANNRLSLGLSNAFFIDSICWSHAGKGGNGNSYNFNATNSYALFRGIGGGRMSLWTQGDASGDAVSGSNVRGNTCDFSFGQVDALIDRLYMGINRTNTTGQTIQNTLTIGGTNTGTVFDVNTVILGCQITTNRATNVVASTEQSGTLNVNSNAVFKVNGTLHLGYTVAPAIGTPTWPEQCRGTININNSGTLMASNILAGGVTKLSINNNISVNNSGKLIVTNKFGASDARINSLTLANNAELTLLAVALGQTAIYTKTFAAASACTIRIPAIAGYVSGTVTIPLISYTVASPVISGLSIVPPSGLYFLTAVDDGAGTINVTLGDRVPQTVVWRGNLGDVWDTSVPNWVTQIGSLQTNFYDGDSVVFDDSVGAGPTSINILGSVAPGQVFAANGIVVSNANYTFGGGTIIGSSTLKKAGTGTLTINTTLSPGVLLAQGSLAGIGTVGPTTLQNGTTMTGFSGTINGGLSASNATVTVSGTVNGGLNLRAGSLANIGIINGTTTLATNVTLNNLPSGIMNARVPWTVTTNSTLINNGTIRQYSLNAGAGDGLTVNGSLIGTGIISTQGTNAISDVRVTMGVGGTMTIGNSANEITNNTIAVRLDLLNQSTTIYDVDNSTFANDKIFLTEGFNVGKVNFGAGNNLGGTIVINKLAGPAFNLATSISLFDLNSNVPDNSQPAIPGFVPAPAPGLVWNTAAVISNLTLTVTGPPALTNYVSVNPTNGTRSLVLSWQDTFRGWRLEQQTNSLAVGLQSPSTNWTTLVTSLGGTNSLYFPDITNAPNDFYYRAVVTISTTNSGVSFPAAFYRLNYP